MDSRRRKQHGQRGKWSSAVKQNLLGMVRPVDLSTHQALGVPLAEHPGVADVPEKATSRGSSADSTPAAGAMGSAHHAKGGAPVLTCSFVAYLKVRFN